MIYFIVSLFMYGSAFAADIEISTPSAAVDWLAQRQYRFDTVPGHKIQGVEFDPRYVRKAYMTLMEQERWAFCRRKCRLPQPSYESMLERMPFITNLVFTRNDYDFTGMTIDRLFRLLTKQNSQIHALTLYNVKNPNAVSVAFADALRADRAPNLLSLRLIGHKFDDEAVCFIANSLKSNTKLEALGFERSDLSDQAIVAIVEAVKSHPTLQKLDLVGNAVGDENIRELSNLLNEKDKLILRVDNKIAQQLAGFGERVQGTSKPGECTII